MEKYNEQIQKAQHYSHKAIYYGWIPLVLVLGFLSMGETAPTK